MLVILIFCLGNFKCTSMFLIEIFIFCCMCLIRYCEILMSTSWKRCRDWAEFKYTLWWGVYEISSQKIAGRDCNNFTAAGARNSSSTCGALGGSTLEPHFSCPHHHRWCTTPRSSTVFVCIQQFWDTVREGLIRWCLSWSPWTNPYFFSICWKCM